MTIQTLKIVIYKHKSEALTSALTIHNRLVNEYINRMLIWSNLNKKTIQERICKNLEVQTANNLHNNYFGIRKWDFPTTHSKSSFMIVVSIITMSLFYKTRLRFLFSLKIKSGKSLKISYTQKKNGFFFKIFEKNNWFYFLLEINEKNYTQFNYITLHTSLFYIFIKYHTVFFYLIFFTLGIKIRPSSSAVNSRLVLVSFQFCFTYNFFVNYIFNIQNIHFIQYMQP